MKKFFSTALARGLFWQLIGTLVGAGLITGIRAAMGLSITDTFFFTEPAWVLGAFFGVLFFLAGNGSVSDWFKWARGIDTPEHHEEHYTGWEKYLNVSLDHKVIGIQYTVTALILISIGGLFALIFRTELAQSQLQFLTVDMKLFGQNGPQLYNTLMSLHGMIMIVSILLGVAGIINYVVPLLLGAQDMAFPRLNAFSFWMAVPAAVLLLMSLVLGGFGTGWTGYPPLSARAPVGVQMFFLGVFHGWLVIHSRRIECHRNCYPYALKRHDRHAHADLCLGGCGNIHHRDDRHAVDRSLLSVGYVPASFGYGFL